MLHITPPTAQTPLSRTGLRALRHFRLTRVYLRAPRHRQTRTQRSPVALSSLKTWVRTYVCVLRRLCSARFTAWFCLPHIALISGVWDLRRFHRQTCYQRLRSTCRTHNTVSYWNSVLTIAPPFLDTAILPRAFGTPMGWLACVGYTPDPSFTGRSSSSLR